MRMLSILMVTTLAALSLACGNPVAKVREAAERARQSNELKEFGLALHSYHEDQGKMPASQAELDTWTKTNPAGAMSPSATASLQSGQITVIWGYSLKKSMDKVVAFRQATNDTVLVLMGAGSVQPVSRTSFASLPLAVPAQPGDDDKPEDPEPKTGSRK